jgi:Uma2 family endonuclease
VVHGELLVTNAPRVLHQRAILALAHHLGEYLRAMPDVELLHAPADIELDEHTLVQPDLFVTRRVSGGAMASWKDVHLLLAIEVLSPSTARYDRLIKRDLYHREGIEYWIVDLDARVVERWPPGEDRPDILADTLEWHLPGADGGCILNLEAFFSEVHR